jgi:glycosyltransferase involved in cell wall biosynthesis
MKIALVHEFLTQFGGAERVLACLHEMFPQAPVFTLIHDKRKTKGAFATWNVQTSFLQKLPGAVGHYKWFLPLMPAATESLDLRSYDLVISDSSAFAKGINVPKSAIHVCYCHTPTRYLWQSMEEYFKTLRYPRVVKKLAKWYLKFFLQKWDYEAAQRPSFMIANSRTVQKRILNYYGRSSAVIYPPVNTEFFTPGADLKKYFLTGSRLEPYKRIDLVVEAFGKIGLPLKVVGAGTDLENLKRTAKSNIEFRGQVSDDELRDLYRAARAFVFPAYEDAGMMVLESLACGTPVLGLNAAGTGEFVRHGVDGILFDEQSETAIIDAVQKFLQAKFDEKILRQRAERYGKQEFKRSLEDFIKSAEKP